MQREKSLATFRVLFQQVDIDRFLDAFRSDDADLGKFVITNLNITQPMKTLAGLVIDVKEW